MVLKAVLGRVVLVFDVGGQSVCSTNGVFACNNCKRGVSLPALNSFRNYGSNEFQDVGANGAGNLEYTVSYVDPENCGAKLTISASSISLTTSALCVLELMAR